MEKKPETELITQDPAPMSPVSGVGNVEDLLKLAITEKMDVGGLEKLLSLHERVADRAAAKAFGEALARFQQECPQITKSSKATIKSRATGAGYSYNYADLDHIVKIVRPVCFTNGLSFTWDGETDGNKIKATCVLRHVDGHSESSSFECPTGTSAGMSEQQKVAAANSFARRQSLVQVLGLTLTDPDTDGAGIPSGAVITAKMVADLEAMADEVGADYKKFLAFLGVTKLEELPITDFSTAVAALEAKRDRG